MNYSLPGTPAADETCLQSTGMQEIYCDKRLERTQHTRLLPGFGESYPQIRQLSEEGSEQPGQGGEVKHPQSRLSLCAWHHWSQDAGLPPPGSGGPGKSARQPIGPDLDECCSPTH